MDLTTLERVQRFLPGAAEVSEEDPLLVSLITSVSAHVEQFLRRRVQTIARTEIFDWSAGQRKLFLPAYPISLSPAIDIRFDPEGDFADTTVVDSDYYRVKAEQGIVHFTRWAPTETIQGVRVTWTGGMGATTDALADAFPSVVQAATMQVVHEFRKRRRLDVGSINAGGQSFSMASEIKLLDHVEAMLQPFVCMGFGP